jgi:hypothetical protein
MSQDQMVCGPTSDPMLDLGGQTSQTWQNLSDANKGSFAGNPWGGGLGVLGLANSAYGFSEAYQKGDYWGMGSNTLNFAQSGTGLAQWAAPFTSMAPSTVGALGQVGGVAGMGAGAIDLTQGGINTYQKQGTDPKGPIGMLKGLTNMAGGYASFTGDPATAAVLGSAALGLSAGDAWGSWADKWSKDNGTAGKDAFTGQNKSCFDIAAEKGVAAENWTKNTFGLENDSTFAKVVGGGAAGVMGIGAGVGTAMEAGWKGLTSLF